MQFAWIPKVHGRLSWHRQQRRSRRSHRQRNRDLLQTKKYLSRAEQKCLFRSWAVRVNRSPVVWCSRKRTFTWSSRCWCNRQVQIQAERTIPVGAIKFISCSTLRDDWFSIGVGSPQEPDPLISCIFKTEFFTQLHNVLRGGMTLRIADT